jgi:hypothetical protein
MTNGAAGAAVAVAAIANAIKAMGPIVVVEPQVFLDILQRAEEPLVVHAPAGLVSKYKYLTSYKGLIFFTKSKDELLIPASVETISAKKIELPM